MGYIEEQKYDEMYELLSDESKEKVKNIDKTNANKKIKEEIEKSQEQNTKLAELGYNTITRDATSDTYKIENAKEFFLGDKGYLYIIYPYGNKEYTSEMDIVIIK